MKGRKWQGHHTCRQTVQFMLRDCMAGPLHLGAAMDLTDASLTEAIGAMVREASSGTVPREVFRHRRRVVRSTQEISLPPQ